MQINKKIEDLFTQKRPEAEHVVLHIFSPKGSKESHLVSFANKNPIVIQAGSDNEYLIQFNQIQTSPESIKQKKIADDLYIYITNAYDVNAEIIIIDYFLYFNQHILGVDEQGNYKTYHTAPSEGGITEVVLADIYQPKWIDTAIEPSLLSNKYAIATGSVLSLSALTVLAGGATKKENEDALKISGLVSITGNPKEGEVLTANISDANGVPKDKISYQWYRGEESISKATESTYKTVQADVGETIKVNVRYTDNDKGFENIASKETEKIENVNNEGKIIIEGKNQTRQTLVANLTDEDGLPDADKIRYQWFADDIKVTTNHAEKLTLTKEHVGKKITVRAIYTDKFEENESVTSEATETIDSANTKGRVVIVGTNQKNQTLVAKVSDVDGLPDADKIVYEWFADNIKLSTNNAEKLTLTKEHIGKKITVRAIYTDKFNEKESVVSEATKKVENAKDKNLKGQVFITGDVIEDGVLTANITDANGVPNKVFYQWYRGDQSISGANQSIYKPVQADVGKTIKVKVRYTDKKSNLENITSADTKAISNTNDTGKVTIIGDNIQGKTLVANVTDDDGISNSISYQWFANNTEIIGKTTKSLLLTQNEVGKIVTVKAQYTDNYDHTENITSTATQIIQNTNDAGVVNISGELLVGKTLTADLQDADGINAITVRYQWYGDNVAISGANLKTYQLTTADVDKSITVKVTYRDKANNLEDITSIPTQKIEQPASANPFPSMAELFHDGLASLDGFSNRDANDKVTYMANIQPDKTAELASVYLDVIL